MLGEILSYKEKDFTTKIKIFGIPIWKCKISKGVEKFYLFNIIYYKRSSRHKLYKEVLKNIGTKYENIYINFNCSGETYLCLAYLKPAENSVLIATKKYHIDLCRMLHPDIDCYYLPEILKLRSFDSVYKEFFLDKNFYNLLPFKHFTNLENKLQQGLDVHYCKEICKTMNINYTDTAKRPVITEDAKKSAIKKVNRLGLNLEKFVFVCPESQSNEDPDGKFWENTIDDLYKQGYDVFLNTIHLKQEYGYAKTCYLTFEEAYYIASLSKKVIGLRSGFIEYLTSISDFPITCYYTDFKYRGSLPPMSANKVLNGFSLKILPNVSKQEITEYIITNK